MDGSGSATAVRFEKTRCIESIRSIARRRLVGSQSSRSASDSRRRGDPSGMSMNEGVTPDPRSWKALGTIVAISIYRGGEAEEQLSHLDTVTNAEHLIMLALIEAFLIFSFLFVLATVLLVGAIKASIGLIRHARTRFGHTATLARTRILHVHSHGTNLVARSNRSGLMPLAYHRGSSAHHPTFQ